MLADEGRSVSDEIVGRIAKTLDAAALDERSRSLLRAGRLTEELEPPGFEALAGMTPSASAQKRPTAGKAKTSDVAEARRRVSDAKREARAREREAVLADREAERSERAAAEARGVAQEARQRADDADRAVAEAEAALRAARRR
jgi:hypothetical protein